ncbi:MAG: type II toxin-antitoxin system RelE/ParE family toxin [Hyphomicrobiaceae bacterium]
MSTVRLSPQAISDIEDVFEYGLNQFGLDQAHLYLDEMFKQFDLLAKYPHLGLPLASQRYAQALKFGYGRHIIVYTGDNDGVTIRRVFHGRTNYSRYL